MERENLLKVHGCAKSCQGTHGILVTYITNPGFLNLHVKINCHRQREMVTCDSYVRRSFHTTEHSRKCRAP